jgi:hypothetical protein
MLPRRGLTLLVLLSLGVLAGCDPAKEVPKEITLTVDPADEGPAAPAESDPEAKAYVEKCLAAATEGHPERLLKAKATASTVKGLMRVAGGDLTSTTRKVEAIWPDRLRVSYEFSTGEIKRITIGLRSPDVWAFNLGPDGESEFVPPNAREYADILSVDAVGHLWVPMLVPLQDQATIIFGMKKETVDNQGAVTVKASIRDCPVFTLWFNEATGLLGQITYTHTEAGSKLHKMLRLDAHKLTNGILLPGLIEFKRNGEMVERWEVTSWDFPEKIEDSTFDRPVQKN